ncbi:NrdH-redoxin [Patescibacteria group bacterium]|jgi:glutaredoxin-like YruB-family protein|nr:NrdH-redoxin [Patescibacteria group bacterium]MCL5114442.1 NrdH-redoxin [Patescibacteria group bacterium]
MENPNVTIYTTPTCVFCRMAKAFFRSHNVEYVEKDVAKDLQARQDMVTKSGQLGVPVIDVGGQIVVGFDQATLAKLLNIK